MKPSCTSDAIEPILSPFVVVIDTREQTPWTFQGLTAGRELGNAPIAVPTARGTLASGDYSIEGLTDRVAIERKSLGDLVGTLTTGRARFIRELERLAGLDFAAVIVEASWRDIANYQEHRPQTKVSIRSLVGSILAMQQRFSPVAWLTAGDRRFAEGLAYRTLERFWLDDRDGKRPVCCNGRQVVANSETCGAGIRQSSALYARGAREVSTTFDALKRP